MHMSGLALTWSGALPLWRSGLALWLLKTDAPQRTRDDTDAMIPCLEHPMNLYALKINTTNFLAWLANTEPPLGQCPMGAYVCHYRLKCRDQNPFASQWLAV